MRTVQLLLAFLSAWAVLASGQPEAITSNPAILAALATARKSISGPDSLKINNALPDLATQVATARREGYPKKPSVDAALMRLQQQVGRPISTGNKVAVERAMGAVYDAPVVSSKTSTTKSVGPATTATTSTTRSVGPATTAATTGASSAATGSSSPTTTATSAATSSRPSTTRSVGEAATATTTGVSSAATGSSSPTTTAKSAAAGTQSASSLNLGPAPAPAPVAAPPAASRSGLSAGEIAGIVIACVLGPLLLVAMLVCCCMWQRRSDRMHAKGTAVTAADAKVIDTAEPIVYDRSGNAAAAGAYPAYAKDTDAALADADRDVKLDTDQLRPSRGHKAGTAAAVAGGLGAAGVAAAAATRGRDIAGNDSARVAGTDDADVALDMSQLRSAHLPIMTPTEAHGDLADDTLDQGSRAYQPSGISGTTAGAAGLGAAGLGAAGLGAAAAGDADSSDAAAVDTSQLRSAHLHTSMKESAADYPRSMYPDFDEDASTQLSTSPPADKGAYLHHLAEPTPPSSLQNYPAKMP